jgi:hypothetical protein
LKKEVEKSVPPELLSAVRFGPDKIFKSKDSSITDEDIDIILGAGKKSGAPTPLAPAQSSPPAPRGEEKSEPKEHRQEGLS